MGIKVNLNEILKDDRVLIKALCVIVAAIVFITPGLIALFIALKEELVTMEITEIILFAAALSIPLNFLGVVTYLHPYKTLMDFTKKPPLQSFLGVIFGTCIWGSFSGCIIYFIVNKYGDWLAEVISKDIIVQYIAVYFALFSFFGIYFFISATIFLRKIGYDK